MPTQTDKETQVKRPSSVPEQQQAQTPGRETQMHPKPDHGESTYRGSAKLKDKVAIITGGDSGIGKAVAIAFAREGAKPGISYLDEEEDARDTADWIQKAGSQVSLIPGDISREEQCTKIVAETVNKFGRVDILINNAAYQMTYKDLQDIS